MKEKYCPYCIPDCSEMATDKARWVKLEKVDGYALLRLKKIDTNEAVFIPYSCPKCGYTEWYKE